MIFIANSLSLRSRMKFEGLRERNGETSDGNVYIQDIKEVEETTKIKSA